MKMLRVSFAGKLTCFMEQYAVPFLMVLFVAVLSACHDNLIEEGGGEVVPPEEIVTPPVYILKSATIIQYTIKGRFMSR